MPCKTLDFQLLVQTFLYAANIVLGLAVAVPLWITIGDFNGSCMLYAGTQTSSDDKVMIVPSHGINCTFSTYASVCLCVVYGLAMTFYSVYLLTRNDPRIGSRMWVFPFIVVNSVIAFVTFISSCIISVGFKTFCDTLLKAIRETGRAVDSCAHEKVAFHSFGGVYRVHLFYTKMTVTQIASWCTLLVWVLQIMQGIIRFIRNRRLAKAQDDSDLGNFAASNPSA